MERDQIDNVGRTFRDVRQGELDEQRNRDLRVLGVWVCAFIAALCILSAWLPRAYGSERDYEKELSTYVDWLHRTMKPRYARKAKELIPTTLKYCMEYGVDPLDMGYIFFKESSWRKFKGSKGEVGPGHVMPSPKRRKRFALDTLDGQIEAAVFLWSESRKCGSLERSFAKYASGVCNPRTPTTAKLSRDRAKGLREVYSKFRGI